MSAKERDSHVALEVLILIFPSLKKGGAGGGSQIHKLFLAKLSLLGN